MKISLRIPQLEQKLDGLYSGDLIPSGKVRGLFLHGGRSYVITGMYWQHGLQTAYASEAIPIRLWTGNVYDYHEKQIVTDEDRLRFYEGVKVKCRGEILVLSGQRIEFICDRSQTATDRPVQLALF